MILCVYHWEGIMKVLKSVLNAVACIIGVCGCLQNETAAFPCCVIGLPGVVASDSGVKKVVSGQALAEDICSKIGLPCPVWTKKSEIPTTHDVDNSENEPNENSVWLSSPSSDYESSDCDEEVFDLNQSSSCAEKQILGKELSYFMIVMMSFTRILMLLCKKRI